jgi:hypothetical protein
MKFSTRLTLILTLTLALATGALAQDDAETTTTATTTAATTTTAAEKLAVTPHEKQLREQEMFILRDEFSSVLRQQRPELPMILALDPTLLNDEAFVQRYPELAAYLARHPEIRRNPRFYMGEFPIPGRVQNESEALEGLLVMGSFFLAALALSWFIRTVIEQRRWNRLSKTQAEVHNKILDRFSSSEELLAYIRTPAGTKFLESAPIPLHEDQPVQNAPFGRILRSIQIGTVVAAGGLGMIIVGSILRNADDLFAFGVIGFCVGIGFIGSAFVSIVLSRRLGQWKGPGAEPVPGISESELVR